MAMSFVGKTAARRFTKKYLNENSNRDPDIQWHPVYEYHRDKRGKIIKTKKGPLPGLTAEEAELLAKIRKWVYRLDVKHSFMGMRFGWAAVIGAVPEVGDAVDLCLALYVYSMCRKFKPDAASKLKMKAWIATDALIGLVPVVGDLIDASIKCNAKNCEILENFLIARHLAGETTNGREGKKVAGTAANGRRHDDSISALPAPEALSEYEHDEPPRYQTREGTPAGTSTSRSRTVRSEKPRRMWSSKK